MENDELIKIFDENKKEIGVATRKDVHQKGYWHETFHCWFISRNEEQTYIYFQKRSESKKDYPNLLDITAAGHILSHETIEDGVREVKEETGIKVSMEDLTSLGTIDYCIIQQDLDFIDKEIAHIFLYKCKGHFNEFNLSSTEVAGFMRTDFESFSDLWLNNRAEIQVEGIEVNQTGEVEEVTLCVGKNNFVPHDASYYSQIITFINELESS